MTAPAWCPSLLHIGAQITVCEGVAGHPLPHRLGNVAAWNDKGVRVRLTRDGDVVNPGALRDPAEGQRRRAEGEARALDAAAVWREQALAALRSLAILGEPFTSEDVVERVGLPSKGVLTNANNAVGALISSASRRGLIEPTGRLVSSSRPSSHGATLREWRGTERGRAVGQ